MDGENRVTLLGKPEDGGAPLVCLGKIPVLTISTEYVVTMPNMYARGILFGKMVLELGDTCLAKNEKNKMFCDLEFKTKVCVIFSCSTIT